MQETKTQEIKEETLTSVEEQDEQEENKKEEFSELKELAKLLNLSIERVKDECCTLQISNLLSMLKKVIVRYSLSEQETERILYNCFNLGSKEVLVSPAYLPSVKRQAEKLGLTDLKISVIVDFPFGESAFKSKLTDIKDALKIGVSGVTVMLPAMLLTREKVREYKRQLKIVGRANKIETSVAFAVNDLNEDAIRLAVKFFEKSKVKALTLVFGEASESQVKHKMSAVNGFKGNKKVYVLGNVETPEAVMELKKLNVDGIYTPYTERIGENLIKRFNVKSVNLR